MDLTDERWTVLEPLIGELPRRADGMRPYTAQDPGWSPTAPLSTPLEGQATLRLVGQLPPPGRPV